METIWEIELVSRCGNLVNIIDIEIRDQLNWWHLTNWKLCKINNCPPTVVAGLNEPALHVKIQTKSEDTKGEFAVMIRTPTLVGTVFRLHSLSRVQGIAGSMQNGSKMRGPISLLSSKPRSLLMGPVPGTAAPGPLFLWWAHNTHTLLVHYLCAYFTINMFSAC